MTLDAVGRCLLIVLVGSALCVSPTHADGEVTFGGQWWDQTAPEARFQEFRVVPRDGFLESFMLREWSGRNAVRFFGTNALQDDQAAGLSWSNGVRWRADLGLTQIPHLFSQVARSPYTEIRPGVFALPDTLQRTNEENPGAYVSTMSDLLATSPKIPLGFRTDIARARLRARPARGWRFELRGVRRNRSGGKPYGASFGFNNAIELVEPIDQRMWDADAIAEYAQNRISVQASAGLSAFDNRVGVLRWDNPKRLTDRSGGDGGSTGQLDLYPDNRAVRGSVNVGLELPGRTALTGSVGASRFTQDDDWLPFTINTAIAQASLDSLPGRSTDAKATRLSGDVRLTARGLPGLTGTLRFHQHHYDNDTPVYTFIGRVATDVSFSRGEQTNHPFGNKQMIVGADLDYDLANVVKVGGTVEHRKRDHTFREVEEDAENVFGVRARTQPLGGLMLHADYRHGDRELDHFLDEDYKNAAGAFIEQPELRRFDVADRRQDLAKGDVSWSVSEQVQLSAGYVYERNDYHRSRLGLTEETRQAVNTEGVVTLSDRLELSGGYGFDQMEADQRSRESAAVLSSSDTTNWTADLKERNVFVFAGAEWWAAPEKLSLALDYVFSRAFNDYRLSNFKRTAQDLPSTFYRRHEVTAEARWRVTAVVELAGRYGFEQLDVTDFASEDVPLLFPVTGTANAIFLGDSSQDYRAHRLALVATRRF